jgi:membrane associated rhomboid family serine protease
MSSRPTTTQRVPLGGFGSGPIPRDLWILLGVLFVTFSLQFFSSTVLVPELLRLTPLVWQRGLVWQLATYPFIGYGGPSLWILLELYILFLFGRDVYAGLGRRHFWRLVLTASIIAALVAVAVHALGTLAGGMDSLAPFGLMQGQRILIVIFIAAFATANRHATIMFMFVLPIEARWFIGLEILFAFIGFLQTRDLPGFLGICTAVGVSYLYIRSGGGRRKGGLRETRLQLERWWIQKKLDRMKKKRGFRVIQGENKPGDTKRGPWVH